MKYIFQLFILIYPLIIFSQKKWSLEDCIEHAKINNIDVLKQLLQNETFLEDIQDAKGNYFPDASFNASQGFSLGNSFNVSTGVGQLESSFNSFSLSASLNIFNGFSNRYNLQKAKLNAEKGQQDLNQIALDVSLNIANNYLSVLFNKEIVAVALEQVEISSQEVKRLQQLNDLALAPRSELLQMQSTLASDEKELVIAENNLQNSIIELKELLDIENLEDFDIEPIDILEYEQVVFNSKPNTIYEIALDNNPLIQSSILNNEIGEKNIQLERANFYPRLNFNYNYGTNYYHVLGRDDVVFNQETQMFEENGFWTQLRNNRTHFLSFNLTVPIFNRLTTRSNFNKAKIQMEINKNELVFQKNQLKNKIEIAYNDVLTAKATLESSSAASIAQKEAFEINQLKNTQGLISNFDFLNSKSLYIKTESELVQAKYDYLFKIKVLNYYIN